MNRFAAEIVTGACMFVIGACAGAGIEGSIKDREMTSALASRTASLPRSDVTIYPILNPPEHYGLSLDSCRLEGGRVGAISGLRPCTIALVEGPWRVTNTIVTGGGDQTGTTLSCPSGPWCITRDDGCYFGTVPPGGHACDKGVLHAR